MGGVEVTSSTDSVKTEGNRWEEDVESLLTRDLASAEWVTMYSNFLLKNCRRMMMVNIETDDVDPRHIIRNRMTCCHKVQSANKTEFKPVTVMADTTMKRQSTYSM